MKMLVALALCLSYTVAHAAGRDSGYFPLAEGSTEEVLRLFNACLDTYKAQPVESQKKVVPVTFCYCLTDAARLNLRATGKLMPDEEKGAVCREVARPKK